MLYPDAKILSVLAADDLDLDIVQIFNVLKAVNATALFNAVNANALFNTPHAELLQINKTTKLLKKIIK